MKELTLAEKKRINEISFCNVIYYIRNKKSLYPMPTYSCPTYDEILQVVEKNIREAGFQNVKIVTRISDANCIAELIRKVDCFSGNSYTYIYWLVSIQILMANGFQQIKMFLISKGHL